MTPDHIWSGNHVNKDWAQEDKNQAFEDKDKDRDWTYEDDLTYKDKNLYKDLQHILMCFS